jgi:hypothetical protein
MRGGYACSCATPGAGGNTAAASMPAVPMSAQMGGAKKRAAKKAGPKRKLTPYNIFVKKQYAILKAKFPNDTAPQIMKKIGAEWRKQ